MSEQALQALQALAEERFAKLFGRLQRKVGDAVEEFLSEVQPGTPDAWMDDTRALALLEIVQGDVPLAVRDTEPATWWQRLKADRFPHWLLVLFPVQRRTRPCRHAPWDTLRAGQIEGWKAHVRAQIDKELPHA
mgnify:CR=1 FL=1